MNSEEMQALYTELAASPPESGSLEESTFVRCWAVETLVRESGFTGYFMTDAGAQAQKTVAALVSVGAPGMALQLEAAIKYAFRGHAVPQVPELRHSIIASLGHEALQALGECGRHFVDHDDTLMLRLKEYVTLHHHQIHGAAAHEASSRWTGGKAS
jgi:hypothetical protein